MKNLPVFAVLWHKKNTNYTIAQQQIYIVSPQKMVQIFIKFGFETVYIYKKVYAKIARVDFLEAFQQINFN